MNKMDEWTITWLPALLGPAILVAAYLLMAKAGQWRIDRQIDASDTQ